MSEEQTPPDWKTYVEMRDQILEGKIRGWLKNVAITNVVAVLPVIFFLGMIYAAIVGSIDKNGEQDDILQQRGEWMQDRETWERAIQAWAEEEGFTPPRYLNDQNRGE